MKTVLFIHGGKVVKDAPSERMRYRLTWAINYYRKRHTEEDIIFFVAGRCGNMYEEGPVTEAEVGRRAIHKAIQDAKVIKEDISVETIGNYVFSRPLITDLKPDKVLIIMSDVMKNRIEFLAKKFFYSYFAYEFVLLEDELTGKKNVIERELKALNMLKNMLVEIADSDDMAAREFLLYRTPFYFKGTIKDKEFFDAYWDGGYDDFLGGRAARK